MPGTFTWTPETYNAVGIFLSTGLKPLNVSKSRWKRIKSKIHNVILKDKSLYLVDEQAKEKEILPEVAEVRREIMVKYYQDPSKTAQDPVVLHRRLSEDYVGFSRREVADFLLQQRAWQMSKRKIPKTQRAITPLFTFRKNEHFQCDFVVFSEKLKWANLGYS